MRKLRLTIVILCSILVASPVLADLQDGGYRYINVLRQGLSYIWNFDMWFGSGSPWCDVRAQGAKGDGITDDTAAFQACFTLITTKYGAGTINIPPGTYCTFSGVIADNVILGDVIWKGSGVRASVLDVCGHNVTAFTVNKQFGAMENMAIYGYGMHSTDTPFGINVAPAVLLNSGASYFALHHTLVQGGGFPIDARCNGCRITEVTAQYMYGDNSGVRAANARIINSGQYWLHDSFDQVVPTGTAPTFPTTVVAWTNAHVYTANTIAQFTCSGITWFAQVTVGGTSGASQPACQPYLRNITDNTVTWQMVAPTTSYAMMIDTGVNEVVVDSVDVTGFFGACVGITNSFSGTAPQNIWLHSMTPGGCYNQGYLINAGSNITIHSGDVQGCIFTSCNGLFVNGIAGVFLTIDGVNFHNGGLTSVTLGANTTGVFATGNTFNMGTTNSVVLGASTNAYSFIGNFCVHPQTGAVNADSGRYFPSAATTPNFGNPFC